MKWNEVTWYSRLGAFILFFAVIPVLAFYMGTLYQEVNRLTESTETSTYIKPVPVNPVGGSPEPTEVIESPIEELPITPSPSPTGACYRGGCSSQLCTDKPDMVSTCEYREEYGCYQSATCERQPNGQCGWTQTESLKMCLSNAGTV